MIRIGRLEVDDSLDRDEELEVDLRDETLYLTRSQVENLRDHLTMVLNKQTGGVPDETISAVISLAKDAASAHLNSEFNSCLSKIRKLLTAAPQPAEQKPAPDVSALVEALEKMVKWYENTSLGDNPAFQYYDLAKKALLSVAAHRKQGGEK